MRTIFTVRLQTRKWFSIERYGAFPPNTVTRFIVIYDVTASHDAIIISYTYNTNSVVGYLSRMVGRYEEDRTGSAPIARPPESTTIILHVLLYMTVTWRRCENDMVLLYGSCVVQLNCRTSMAAIGSETVALWLLNKITWTLCSCFFHVISWNR